MRFPALRLAALMLAALLAAVGAAQAQVAAPRLAPLQFGSLTANPATMQWSEFSHVGAVIAKGEQTAEINGVSLPAGEGDSNAQGVQVRKVWESFSLGAEIASLEFEIGNSTDGFRNTDISVFNAGLAFRVGESVTLGLAVEKTDIDESRFDPAATPPATQQSFELSLTLAGISVRLGEVYFVGAALGKETVTADFLPNELDRNVIRLGVGLSTGMRDPEERADAEATRFQVHLEVFREVRDPFEIGPVARSSDTTTDGFVAELLWGSIILGFKGTTKTEEEIDGAGVKTGDTESREGEITIGWVPEKGLSLLISLSKQEIEDKLSPATAEGNSIVLGVGYVF